MVSFRSARKIKDYLVRAKLYPLERKVVRNNIESTDLFSSTVTGEKHKINHYFNFDSKCLVYLITCRTCKLQYTGHTCDAFWKRWNNYMCCARKTERGEGCKQKDYHEHKMIMFFLNDAQVNLIDKIQS